MNKNHGGKREGAGRKKNTSVDSLVRITITIYSEQKEFLLRSHKSVSAKIQELIQELIEKEKGKKNDS